MDTLWDELRVDLPQADRYIYNAFTLVFDIPPIVSGLVQYLFDPATDGRICLSFKS